MLFCGMSFFSAIVSCHFVTVGKKYFFCGILFVSAIPLSFLATLNYTEELTFLQEGGPTYKLRLLNQQLHTATDLTKAFCVEDNFRKPKASFCRLCIVRLLSKHGYSLTKQYLSTSLG
jgi:hypothetical protein